MRRVAIVGAGFSGTMVAFHLLARQEPALNVRVVERARRFGPGLAYGVVEPAHLLNVPAGNMSALASDPDHFVRFARRHWPSAVAGDFLPRATYGEYLEQLLRDAMQSTASEAECVSGEVEAILPDRHSGGFRVSLLSGQRCEADAVVLATGNYPPADPLAPFGLAPDEPRYVKDAWVPGALAGVIPGERVLLIGSGLTALDVALSVHARGASHIDCVSRHGWMPLPHRVPTLPSRATPVQARILAEPPKARGYLRCLRDTALEVERDHGQDWRDVVGGIRPITPQLWARLPLAERQRFLRHLRTLWDVHRHRCAHTAAASFVGLLAQGLLEVHAGRIAAVSRKGDGLDVRLHRRDGRLEILRVDRVVNCTGPAGNPARIDDPLVASLLASGTIVPDELGLGISVDAEGQAIDANGRVVEGLFVVGPALRARDWEATAVPELRVLAERTAAAVFRILS